MKVSVKSAGSTDWLNLHFISTDTQCQSLRTFKKDKVKDNHLPCLVMQTLLPSLLSYGHGQASVTSLPCSDQRSLFNTRVDVCVPGANAAARLVPSKLALRTITLNRHRHMDWRRIFVIITRPYNLINILMTHSYKALQYKREWA